METVQEKEITLSSIIVSMYDANLSTASLCSRLSVIVDKLFIGQQPIVGGTDGQCKNQSEPIKGDLTILAENADRHCAINERLDELVSQLERVIK